MLTILHPMFVLFLYNYIFIIIYLSVSTWVCSQELFYKMQIPLLWRKLSISLSMSKCFLSFCYRMSSAYLYLYRISTTRYSILIWDNLFIELHFRTLKNEKKMAYEFLFIFLVGKCSYIVMKKLKQQCVQNIKKNSSFITTDETLNYSIVYILLCISYCESLKNKYRQLQSI